jgi:hypothetical protein
MEITLKKYTDTLLKLDEKFGGAIEANAFTITFERHVNKSTSTLEPSIKIMTRIERANEVIRTVANKFTQDDYTQEFTGNGFIKIVTYIDDVHIDLTLA